MTTPTILLIVVCLWVVTTAADSCVSPGVCQNITTAQNCSDPTLISCYTLSPCIRSMDYWSLHLSEWPVLTNQYCLHTWQDILLQDSLTDSQAFPVVCQSLARILITLRLNEKLNLMNSSSLITMMDSADLETLSCCTTPNAVDSNKIHQLYTILVGGYNNYQGQFCPLSLNEAEFSWTVYDYLVLVGLGLAVAMIIGVSVHGILHYWIMCRARKQSDRVQVLYMLLREKYTCYFMVPEEDPENDYVDQYY
jgi:hypothetical protein